MFKPLARLYNIVGLIFSIVLLPFVAQAQATWESGQTSFGNSQTFTVNKPAGVQAGDLLVAGLMFGGGNTVINITMPEGWQQVDRADEGNQIGMAVYYKIATAGDASSAVTSYTWAKPSEGGIVRFALGISRISGIETANPIIGANSAVGDSNTLTAPGLNVPEGALVLGFFTHRNNSNLGSIDGTEHRYGNFNTNPNGPSNMLVSFVASEAGMTDDLSVTDASANWVAMQVAITGVAVPPSPFAYVLPVDPFVYGTAITPMLPQSVSSNAIYLNPITYSVQPALPAGLQLNSATGEISGTPTSIATTETYTVTAANLDGSEQATVQFSIQPRPITVSATSGLQKVYGDTDPELTFGITAGTLAFQDALQPGLLRDAGESVGTYAIVQGSLSVMNDQNIDVTPNYALTFVGSTLEITAKTLTIGGSFEANDKDFDGTRAATFASNALELVGVVTSDVGQVSLSGVVIEFDDANTAGEQPVRITDAALDGPTSSNYSLDIEGAPTALAEIRFPVPPANLTYPVSEINIKYGDVLEPITPVLGQGEGTFSIEPALPTGLQFDPETGTISGVAGEVSPPGVYTVTVTNPDGSTSTDITISIEPRVLTLSGSFEANDKQHDGTVTATFKSNALALVNVLPADAPDVALGATEIAFTDANTPGLQTVSIVSAELTGSKASNYELDLTGAPTAEAQIFMYTISGVAFIDMNGNDEFDSNESPAANIVITAQSNGASGSATTDENGAYTIEALPAGTYQVGATVPDGMYQSMPATTTASVELGQGNPDDTVDFGFFFITNLEGRVVVGTASKTSGIAGLMSALPTADTRVSGVRTGPAPLKGVAQPNSIQTVGVSSFESGIDADGYFKVENLIPGVYLVELSVPFPWIAVSQNPIEIVLNSGGFIEIAFVIEEDQEALPEPTNSSIAGSVIGVGNTSGLWNPATDRGLPGQVVSISGKSDKGTEVQRFVTTKEDGSYISENLPAGNYTVEINPQYGFSQGWPTALYSIRLDEDQSYGLLPTNPVLQSSSVLDASAGSDVSVGRMTLAIDTNLDGKPDMRVDSHGLLQIVLSGNSGQSQRQTYIQGYSGTMLTEDGEKILVSAPGRQQELGELSTSFSLSTLTYNTGITVVIDGQPLYSDDALSLSSGVDSWPVRNKALKMQSEPINLRDVNGVIKARLLYAELVSQHGIDFGLEKADYGDAPNTYGTMRADLQKDMAIVSGGLAYPNDGARHLQPVIGQPEIYLGTTVAHSANGNPSMLADNDSDDDGVVLPTSIAAGDTLRFDVTVAGNGYLHAWFDWNRDGSFGETEKMPMGSAMEAGATQLSIIVPADAGLGDTFVRFRYTTDETLGPNGPASNGEVEDYMFTIVAPTTDGDGDDDGDTGTPTSDEDDNTGLPTDFRLGQNYPNPFNPTTVIPFDLAQSGDVRLAVYDVTGRKVSTLLNTSMGAGRHSVTFNAAGIPSGVYIVRLEAGGRIMTSKLTLLK